MDKNEALLQLSKSILEAEEELVKLEERLSKTATWGAVPKDHPKAKWQEAEERRKEDKDFKGAPKREEDEAWAIVPKSYHVKGEKKDVWPPKKGPRQTADLQPKKQPKPPEEKRFTNRDSHKQRG
jgi:hypothetical protein